ncbi:MAG: 6,7-dimethyl-8-ribityllumazine synthase [Phycisphaeraceae bacterium]|nr:6,7-dimethyl-8-ribityllumazine synthase [Phycisphaeraceae bacterium]MCW5763682.1 6,7-dimethyl-8-ribityllumazine synthase [Phycisphaeraceae bacterium]
MHAAQSQPPVAIVVSRYNERVTGVMCAGAVEAYRNAGGDPAMLGIIDAAGSFELTGICLHAARSGLYAGVVALGCIIQGQTRHDEHLAAAVAQGLTGVTLATGVPVAFGVLTVRDTGQAEARAGGDKGNKGAEAMTALLESVGAVRAIEMASRIGRPGLVHALSSVRTDKTASSSS